MDAVQQRIQAVIELRELTVALMRQALVREFPEASEEEVDEKLRIRVTRPEAPANFVAIGNLGK